MKKIISTNPGKNFEKISEIYVSTKDQIISTVSSANQAKELWGELPLLERINYLQKALDIFKGRQTEIVGLIHLEIGTPVADIDDEVSWDWGYWQWFLDNALSALSPVTTFESSTSIHKLFYEPLGSVAVITPWNLPFDMFVWGVIPSLLAGNTVIYKAAEECALSGKLFADIMQTVDLPTGVFNVIHGNGQEGSILVESPINAIWFTGSSEVGKKLYEIAGKKFIRATLEMGGSNPAIVCEDADLDLASSKIVSKRFMFSGQTCDADKRLLVHESVKDLLLSKIVEKVKAIEITPLVSQKQLDILILQVEDAVKRGAKVLVGGSVVPKLRGAYYLPTVLDQVTSEMKVWHEEVFGPVLPLMTFKTDEEALVIANNTEYGLGSQVFTRDTKRAEYFARKLKAGNVEVNGTGHFIPQNPFGGYKNSGMGREHGVDGLHELCQIKTVSSPK